MSAELELPDDADAKRQTLAELVAYRRQELHRAAATLSAHPWGPCVCLDTVDWVLDELRRLADA